MNKSNLRNFLLWLALVCIAILGSSCSKIPPDDVSPEQAHKDDLWYKEKILQDIDVGRSLNWPIDAYKFTHLHEAAKGDYIESAKYLISKGVTIDPRAEGKDTPLHRAAQNGSLQVAKLLLENGANVEAKDISGSTPIFWAVSTEKNQKEILDLLSVLSRYKSNKYNWLRISLFEKLLKSA
jgi:ankyrin repeat protein